jgi:hypothetical protein
VFSPREARAQSSRSARSWALMLARVATDEALSAEVLRTVAKTVKGWADRIGEIDVSRAAGPSPGARP